MGRGYRKVPSIKRLRNEELARDASRDNISFCWGPVSREQYLHLVEIFREINKRYKTVK